jgi:hypothetical protein
MTKITIWLTYDLGVGGDFQGLYSWLDDKEAKECGNNNAFFEYSYPSNIATNMDLLKYLKKDLDERKISFTAGNRIYIIFKSIEANNGAPVGGWIIGRRKASPWEGYGTKATNTIDE